MVTFKELVTQRSSGNQQPVVSLKSPCRYKSYFTSSLMAQTNEIEYILIKFLDNTEMNGTVNVLEERDTIQMDLNRLEEWDCMNLMNINKTNARSCTWVTSISIISTDCRRNGLRPVQRRRT